MTGRPIVAVLDPMPATSRHVIQERFGPSFDVRFCEEGQATAEVVGDAVALLTMWGTVDAAVVAEARHAKVIQKLGVGTDKIDTGAARDAGIAVLRAAGVNAEPVAELTVLLMLAVYRNLVVADGCARRGELAKERLRAESFHLSGRTVGLVGFGNIGQAVARRLSAFSVRLVYHDPMVPAAKGPELGATCLALDELLSAADVVSLHLPGVPETRHILGPAEIARMRRGGVVVNTARGSLVDEAALVDAIERGHLLGAGLDVSEHEPVPPCSPLLRCPRVVLTPHVGGAVADNFPRVIQRAYDNVTQVLSTAALRPEDVVVPPTRPS